MKITSIISVSVFLFSGSIYADCKNELYGSWIRTHTSKVLNEGMKQEELPMRWTFSKDKKATVELSVFLNHTNDYECKENEIIIKKAVPAVLKVQKLDSKNLVWAEEASSGIVYYYFAKQ